MNDSTTTNSALEQSTPKTTEDDPASRPSWWSRLTRFLFQENTSEDLRDQLQVAVGHDADDSTAFSAQERLMIANILRYGMLRVEDVMVPRADIRSIEENATLEELLIEFQKSGHSRLPVYRGTLDDPTGMIHVKDVLSWIADNTTHGGSKAATTLEADNVNLKVVAGGGAQMPGGEGKSITELLPQSNRSMTDFNATIKETELVRHVLYVPPSMPVMNLLLRMQSTRVHLALVVDEYGGTDGLLSIEDLVEEVVGDIEDEHDENNGTLLKGDLDTGLVASARVSILALEEELGLDLFQDDWRGEDVDTLGGLIFSLLGRVPVRGEVITHPAGIEIEVLTADPRRIKTLKLTRKDDKPKRKPPVEIRETTPRQ